MTRLDYESPRPTRPPRRAYVLLFAVLGAGVGLWLAVYPLFFWMQAHQARTGFDAGNAGVLFVCTVPLLVPAGAFTGAFIGRRIGRRS